MVSIEMPKYKCHKEVWALKIKKVVKPFDENGRTLDYPSAIIFPENENYSPFEVSPEFVDKHNPQAGGYYVVYKDGYVSFSPAEAFEDGYTLAD